MSSTDDDLLLGPTTSGAYRALQSGGVGVRCQQQPSLPQPEQQLAAKILHISLHCMNTYKKYWLSEITHYTCNHTGFSKVLQAATASAPLLMSGHGLDYLWAHHKCHDLAGRGGGGGGGLRSQAHKKLHYKNKRTTQHNPPSDDRHGTCNELECHQQITIFQLQTGHCWLHAHLCGLGLLHCMQLTARVRQAPQSP